ncbi:MAG: hypothetical protein COT85_01100 [Chlamydiae bacterium CG10_big_fil_rev_8_21_14_0_10_42_34]|nr:MAG: hypothetical protein COT85_01100 [Chlamydiae bacterium CG10_big_fil_rev_8_21_14_0_10_42_34]
MKIWRLPSLQTYQPYDLHGGLLGILILREAGVIPLTSCYESQQETSAGGVGSRWPPLND